MDAPIAALTFDDGPDPTWTPQVLDALAAAGVRATFFVITGRAASHPRLLERMLAEGHAIGLHCAVHERQSDHDEDWARADVRTGLKQLEGLAPRPTLWRTPWGDEAPWTRAVADEEGLRVVAWTIDTHDWRGDGVLAMHAIVRRDLQAGAVVLAHDGLGPGAQRTGCPQTVALIGHAARSAAECDLRLVALDDAWSAPWP